MAAIHSRAYKVQTCQIHTLGMQNTESLARDFGGIANPAADEIICFLARQRRTPSSETDHTAVSQFPNRCKPKANQSFNNVMHFQYTTTPPPPHGRRGPQNPRYRTWPHGSLPRQPGSVSGSNDSMGSRGGCLSRQDQKSIPGSILTPSRFRVD